MAPFSCMVCNYSGYFRKREKIFLIFFISSKEVQCNPLLVNLTVSMTVPQFSKEIYVFFLRVKSILTTLFGWLHHYIRLTISIAATGYARNIILKIYQRQAVTPLAYSQNLSNQQEDTVQRLKPQLTCDMRDQGFFFSQVSKDGEQEGIRSART